ncbi:MAG: hypothetical protein AAB091_07585, partial [Elusimicrobiota bacterium]
PDQPAEVFWKESDLPEYVIISGEPRFPIMRGLLKDFYQSSVCWPKKDRLMGVKFGNIWLDTAATCVYQRRSGS